MSKKDKKIIVENEEITRERDEGGLYPAYDSDIMPDDPRHGIISNRPELFDNLAEPFHPAGYKTEIPQEYDPENPDEEDMLD